MAFNPKIGWTIEGPTSNSQQVILYMLLCVKIPQAEFLQISPELSFQLVMSKANWKKKHIKKKKYLRQLHLIFNFNLILISFHLI